MEDLNEATQETTDESTVGETSTDETSKEATSDKSSDQETIAKSLLEESTESTDESTGDDEKTTEKDDSDGSDAEYVKPDITGILGEGAEFDDGLFDKFTPVLRELGASQEHVDKITRLYAEHVKEAADNYSKGLETSYQGIVKEWRDDSMKEFKGSFKETLNTSGQAIKKFGTQEMIDLFTETGVGNHKEVIKCFSKIGKYFTEDSFVDGEPSDKVSAEDVLYPSMKK